MPGHIVNFLGVAMDVAFMPFVKDRAGFVEGPPIPANWHADMAEFAAALRAVDLADQRFTMIELGCGWGCWMNNTGVAAKRQKLRLRLIGIEGDEGHLEFARQALATNGISPVSYSLLHGIAGARSGVALFPNQQTSGKDWGLEPLFDLTPEARKKALATGKYQELSVIALSDIIGNEKNISLLHMDIQGGEADLVRDCLALLTDRVAYMVIGTHSRAIEGQLMTLLLDAGWTLEIERPAIFEPTLKGPVTRVDGIQGWRNTRLTG
jgi:FkbM family methyltransferase